MSVVPVPEEHQNVPERMLRGVRHEEERAVRVFRPVRRARLRKGRPPFTFSEQHAERELKAQTRHQVNVLSWGWGAADGGRGACTAHSAGPLLLF